MRIFCLILSLREISFARFWNDRAIIFRIKAYNPLTKRFYKQDSVSHDAKKYHYQDLEQWNYDYEHFFHFCSTHSPLQELIKQIMLQNETLAPCSVIDWWHVQSVPCLSTVKNENESHCMQAADCLQYLEVDRDGFNEQCLIPSQSYWLVNKCIVKSRF